MKGDHSDGNFEHFAKQIRQGSIIVQFATQCLPLILWSLHLQQTGTVSMPEAVMQLPHFRKEEGDHRLQPYQEGMEHLLLTERGKSLQKRKATTSVAPASKHPKVAEGEHFIEHYVQLVRKNPAFRILFVERV